MLDRQELRRLRAGLFGTRLGELEAELDTLIAAEPPLAPSALELRVIRLAIWRRTGRAAEALAELDRLDHDCATAGCSSAGLAAKLERAKLLFSQGNLSGVHALLDAVIPQAAAQQHKLVLADAHNLLGLTRSMGKDMASAAEDLARAVELFDELGEEERAADSRSLLGMALVGQGRNLEGITLWRQALRYFEDTDNHAGEARLLERLGYAAWVQGDLVQTRRTLERVLQLQAQHGDPAMPHVWMMARCNLGVVDLREGKLGAALDNLDHAEALAQSVGDLRIRQAVQLSRALIALLQGQPDAARTARAEALELGEQMQTPPDPSDQLLLAALSAELDGAAAARAYWPRPLPEVDDGGMLMSVRGVQEFIVQLAGRSTDAALRELYAQWLEQLEELTGTTPAAGCAA